MYLIKYQIPVQKTVRQEGFIFTEYVTRTVMEEKSKIVGTERLVQDFSMSLTEGNIISVTQF